jgi:hypothetical protein
MDQSGRSRFSDSSGFPVALAFPVIPAFRSFQLSGGSSCPVIISIVWSFLVPVNKRNKKEAQRTIHCVLPIVKDIAYLFCLTAETEIGWYRNMTSSKQKNPRSPRSQT